MLVVVGGNGWEPIFGSSGRFFLRPGRGRKLGHSLSRLLSQMAANAGTKTGKLIAWLLLFALGLALSLYLKLLFDGSDEFAFVPRYFPLAYGYFLGGLLFKFLPKPVRNQITQYTRREYDGKRHCVLTEITVEKTG